jgi:hypothetical protein
MNESCSNCAKLQAQVDQLKKENAALRKRMARILEAVQKARYYIGRALAILTAVKLQTDHYLSQKSGISPRRWGFYKGARWLYDCVAPWVGLAAEALQKALGV